MNDSTALKTIITFSLIAANCAVFLIMFLKGSAGEAGYMLASGASYYPLTLGGEPWRLLTCTFLHFDASHLLNNMLALFAMGSIVEKAFGRLRYTVIYFLSGILASLSSAVYQSVIEVPAVCAGASGAIYGVAGALICLALFKKTARYGVDPRRVPFAVILSIMLTSAKNVDIAAHIGGLIAGFLTALVLFAVPGRSGA